MFQLLKPTVGTAGDLRQRRVPGVPRPSLRFPYRGRPSSSPGPCAPHFGMGRTRSRPNLKEDSQTLEGVGVHYATLGQQQDI